MSRKLSTGSLRRGLTRWDNDDIEKVRSMAARTDLKGNRRYTNDFIARYMGMTVEHVGLIVNSRPNRIANFEFGLQ